MVKVQGPRWPAPGFEEALTNTGPFVEYPTTTQKTSQTFYYNDGDWVNYDIVREDRQPDGSWILVRRAFLEKEHVIHESRDRETGETTREVVATLRAQTDVIMNHPASHSFVVDN